MKNKTNWIRIFYIAGIVLLIIGVVDPLEGSVVILAGSLLIALTTYLAQKKYWEIFLLSFILITAGVFFMFYFSSLGGFGEKSMLSWWWGLLILPYPIGWIITILTLIFRKFKKVN